MTGTALLWFRADLRLHDNPALVAAASADELLPVYVFDPRQFGTAEYGGRNSFEFRKTGDRRVRFLRESVADLRSSLRARGSDLRIEQGAAPAVLRRLVEEHDVDRLHYNALPAPEERDRGRAVVDAVEDLGVDPRWAWGHTLYHPEDLPTRVDDIDDTYTPFRKKVEANASVRDPLDVPDVPPLPAEKERGSDQGKLPPPAALDAAPAEYDDRGALAFEGGERAGLDRLQAYVWERDLLREYKQTRNGLVGPDYSSKFSPWLATGCLSPRRIHEAVEAYERERVANDSTYWLVFELLWRDFFQFQVLKHGGRFFSPDGIREREDIDWRRDEAAFERWAEGRTGVPFVDAAMRELAATGYVSNRARQNAGSFLANDCRIDWRWGAAHFETELVDYDPCSNYGNWAYVAGVGNDSRDRAFDVVAQARRYDPEAAYVTRWCPELAGLPPELAHAPWTASTAERERAGVELGVDYPRPMVDVDAGEGN